MDSESQDREAARAFYNRISSAYDLLADADEHAARERSLALLGLHPGESVLEIGFGTGKSLVRLANAVGPTGRVSGMDISEGMKQRADERIKAGAPEAVVDLRVAPAPPLPWPDAHFDAVTLAFTLELFPEGDQRRLLAEIQRVLKPGGRVSVACMATSRPGEAESLLERTYQWMHRHFPHIVDCRPIDAAALFRANGFLVKTEERLTIWTMPVTVVLAVPGKD
jgi:ubiquinone/menaquinone biosynthesis C-methylase UbiE